MTDQELNEAVARKLGYENCGDTWFHPNGMGILESPPRFCKDIAAAWEIQSVHPFCVWPTKDGRWMAYDDKFDTSYGDEYWFGGSKVKENDLITFADTAAMAIVLAFLKLP